MTAEHELHLAGVQVADDREVGPLLGRAAADLSALRLRLEVATQRAEAAETLADVSLEDQAAALRRQLDEEEAEHRRELDAELDQARAEAAEVVAAATADAIELVRAASSELAGALAVVEGSTERPVEVVVAPEPAPPVVVVEPDVSYVRRAVRIGPVLPMAVVAVALFLVLIALVR